MARRQKTGRGPRNGDSGAHWISYSDMMASLLLVFVLAVVYSVYQYYNMLDLKTQQLNEQQAQLDKATITLTQREEELEQAKFFGLTLCSFHLGVTLSYPAHLRLGVRSAWLCLPLLAAAGALARRRHGAERAAA